MATLAGYKGIATWDGNNIGSGVTIDFSLDMESINVTENGNVYSDFLPGQYSATASVEAHFDDADTAQSALDAAAIAGTNATLLLKFDGSTSHVSGTAFLTNFSVSGGQGDSAKLSLEFQYTGAITFTI